MKGAVPILMYHQVTPHPPRAFRRYAITPRIFAAQMTWLSLTGHRTIGLDALLDHRRGRRSLPSRSVIITFDDGIQDCVEHVAPTLSARGFTAMFYLVAGRVGQTTLWMRSDLGLELPLMDWPAVRSLEAAGFEMGSHTMTHARLPTLPPGACRDELSASRRLLQDRLGHDVVHLAYPFGAFDEPVRRMAADVGYRSACSTRPGLSAPDDDLLALHRVNVYGHDSLLDFACRLWTGRSARELLRLPRPPARPRPAPTPSTPSR
jgi:peptidoglycan/xylan/chitin deacetylase (PgdA/CDA1 family)